MKDYFKYFFTILFSALFTVIVCFPAAASEARAHGFPNAAYSGEGDPEFYGPLLAAAFAEESGEEEVSRPRRRHRHMETQVPEGIPDPLEPLNRVFFEFNDRLYFWLLKPVSRGYEKVVPWEIRTCTRNFFRNLLFPVRAVNCLLQGKIDGFGNELLRFVINTTAGFGGLADPASEINIMPSDEDLGQTLGTAGVGHGIFIMWPVLGPSSARDTVGMAGDAFLSVLSYYPDELKYKFAIRGLDRVNDTSFRIGDYESLKDAAFDPYSAVRDAYFQIRERKVKE
ncbi:MAG TPA: VacJ family lipoprotein [Desulfobacteraceae bacterium]|jgi:phospholipid-binding lipoprotein MlaA|nr:VacJ family lipoprotein [Desulfobacteraceae bacterium]